jgi:hypothetical protein
LIGDREGCGRRGRDHFLARGFLPGASLVIF